MHRSATVLAALLLTSESAQAQVAPTELGRGHTVVPLAHGLEPALLTFTADRPGARLEQETGDGWVSVCDAPCRVAVDPRATFHIDGPNMSTSRALHFEPGGARVEARPGSMSVRAAGIVTTSVGGFIALLGPAIWMSSTCGSECRDTQPRATFQGTAAPLLLVGLSAVAVGVALITHGGTKVRISPSAAAAGRARIAAGGFVF